MDESSFLQRLHEHPNDQAIRSEYHGWLKQKGSPRATYMDLMIRREEIERPLAAIDEQLEQLVQQVGPHWITGMYPKPGKNPFPGGYTLSDGREVQINFLQQYFTYGGLIEGLPTDNMNDKILKRLVDDERARGWWVGEPYLVPPPITPIQSLRNEPHPFGKPEKLPPVTCISRWISPDPARDTAMDCSELSIIWFQDHFAFPIDEAIVQHIVHIDWVSLAVDHEI